LFNAFLDRSCMNDRRSANTVQAPHDPKSQIIGNKAPRSTIGAIS